MTAICSHMPNYSELVAGSEMKRNDTIAPRTAEYQNIGLWIRNNREKAGLGQREVSRRLGKNQSFMYRVERGEQRIDLLQFFDLIEILGLDRSQTMEALLAAIKNGG